MTSSENNGWVLLAGEPRHAIRASGVESVEAHDDGETTIRTVSGKTYRVAAHVDDVLAAVDGTYTVPLKPAAAGGFFFLQ